MVLIKVSVVCSSDCAGPSQLGVCSRFGSGAGEGDGWSPGHRAEAAEAAAVLVVELLLAQNWLVI